MELMTRPPRIGGCLELGQQSPGYNVVLENHVFPVTCWCGVTVSTVALNRCAGNFVWNRRISARMPLEVICIRYVIKKKRTVPIR